MSSIEQDKCNLFYLKGFYNGYISKNKNIDIDSVYKNIEKLLSIIKNKSSNKNNEKINNNSDNNNSDNNKNIKKLDSKIKLKLRIQLKPKIQLKLII